MSKNLALPSSSRSTDNADTAIDAADDRPEADPLGQNPEPDAERDSGREGEGNDRVAIGEAEHDAAGDAPERREIRREVREQHHQQHGERHRGRPIAADHLARDRQLGSRQAAQAVLLGLEVDLAEHAEEMHERRHDRRKDDRLVRDREILHHQERGRAHDRRRDLSAGRGRRLDGAGEVPRIADADHRGNRQRADRDGVGDRRAGDHAEQRRAEDRDLGGSAGEAAGQRGGKIDEEAAEPDARRQHAEQHVVEHVGRHHAERDAVDALAREIEVIDDAFPRVAGMREDARQRRAVERVDHQHDGDDRQRPADAAARRLQQHDDHDRAHDPVDRIRIADAELKVVEDVRDVEAGDDGGDGAKPVDDADPERRAARPALGVAALLFRLQEKTRKIRPSTQAM